MPVTLKKSLNRISASPDRDGLYSTEQLIQALENSLPQLGQVRRGSALIGLTALQPHFEQKAIPRSSQRREIARQGLKKAVLPFHKQLRVRLP
jgi:hypothetical protein